MYLLRIYYFYAFTIVIVIKTYLPPADAADY